MLQNKFILAKNSSSHFLYLGKYCWEIKKFDRTTKETVEECIASEHDIFDKGDAIFYKKGFESFVVRLIGRKINKVIKISRKSDLNWDLIYIEH